MSVLFDPEKNAINIEKHGVSLTEGDGVLNDTLGRTVEDTSSEGEARFNTISTNVFGSLYLLTWTNRDGVERVISVRKPDARERKSYEEKR